MLTTSIKNLQKKVSINANFTADQWQLFTCSMDCAPAASALNKALTAAVNAGKTRDQVEEAMDPVFSRFSKFGAADSEPTHFLRRVLDEIFGAE